jgi:hypothetical protein
VPKPSLIIFDTLAVVRPDRQNRDTMYEGDYRSVAELQAWAGQAGIAIIVLHHQRKMESDDPIDSVSGTLGLTGAVDTVCVLGRTGKGTTLYIRGRDVDEQEKAMLFNKDSCRWTILGEAEEVHVTATRRKILTLLEDASLVSEPLSPKEIATQTNTAEGVINTTLHRMLKDGAVEKVGYGKYIAASRPNLRKR